MVGKDGHNEKSARAFHVLILIPWELKGGEEKVVGQVGFEVVMPVLKRL